jgi:hypothetical protein
VHFKYWGKPLEDIFESAFNETPYETTTFCVVRGKMIKIWPTQEIIAPFTAQGWGAWVPSYPVCLRGRPPLASLRRAAAALACEVFWPASSGIIPAEGSQHHGEARARNGDRIQQILLKGRLALLYPQ